MTTGKTIALTTWTFVGQKCMSLLFNTLSRFVIAFLSRSKCLLISWLQSPSSYFGAQENKICPCFRFFPFICLEIMASGAMTFSFVSFNAEFQALLLSSFTFKRLFSSSLSAIRVVLCAFLRLLIFLLVILIPACDSPSPAFRMMYSAYKLNKQGDNIQP